MYQAESLIAPKALPAKLLPWNVILRRYPRTTYPSPKTAFPRVLVAPSRFLSPCAASATAFSLALSLHTFCLLSPPPLYVINSFPVLPTLGNVSGDPDVCYTSYVYAAPCALLALRRSGKYCRHPLRDAKSDARKPVYRALVLFALYILYVPDSQRHFVHPRRFRTIWCLFVLEGRSVARRCILAVFFFAICLGHLIKQMYAPSRKRKKKERERETLAICKLL